MSQATVVLAVLALFTGFWSVIAICHVLSRIAEALEELADIERGRRV